MKALTPKQRREIYLKVAETLSERPSLFYLCGHLEKHLTGGDAVKSFGEFALFKPEPNNNSLWWIEGDDENYDIRITCMLLCAEMTKTAKQ